MILQCSMMVLVYPQSPLIKWLKMAHRKGKKNWWTAWATLTQSKCGGPMAIEFGDAAYEVNLYGDCRREGWLLHTGIAAPHAFNPELQQQQRSQLLSNGLLQLKSSRLQLKLLIRYLMTPLYATILRLPLNFPVEDKKFILFPYFLYFVIRYFWNKV